MAKKMALAPCPWCGCAPDEWEASWTNMPRIGCRNPDCLVQPRTPADVDQILRWLGQKTATRAALKGKLRKEWNRRADAA